MEHAQILRMNAITCRVTQFLPWYHRGSKQAVLPLFQLHHDDITGFVVCKHTPDWETGKSDALIQYSVVTTHTYVALGVARGNENGERKRERQRGRFLVRIDRKWIGIQPEPVRLSCMWRSHDRLLCCMWRSHDRLLQRNINQTATFPPQMSTLNTASSKLTLGEIAG